MVRPELVNLTFYIALKWTFIQKYEVFFPSFLCFKMHPIFKVPYGSSFFKQRGNVLLLIVKYLEPLIRDG